MSEAIKIEPISAANIATAKNMLFEKWLKDKGFSKNTIDSYLTAVKQYIIKYGEITGKNIAAYRNELIDTYAPKTVNLRCTGINNYLEFMKKDKLKLKNIKIQQKPFLENVISNEDFQYFKKRLLKDVNLRVYYMVWILGATGARVSEFINFKVEHIKRGHIDIYGKGGKMRRIYIPKHLQKDMLKWLEAENRDSGWLFQNRINKDEHLTSRGVSQLLKNNAKKYGIPLEVVYPHSFRHLFARNYLTKSQDILFLADLMGHEDLDTTRIYTRKTATEQRELVDKLIDW